MGYRQLIGRGAAVAAAILALTAGVARAQAAGGDDVDPQRLALAEKIYGMIGTQTIDAMSKAMKGLVATSMSQATGGADTARDQALGAALSDSFDDMMPKVLKATARLMAQDFTVSELQGMLAFYQSPTGQAVLAKMPLVSQQSIQVSLSLLPGFMKTFETDYCGRIACTDQEKQAFAQLNARMSSQAQSSQAHPR